MSHPKNHEQRAQRRKEPGTTEALQVPVPETLPQHQDPDSMVSSRSESSANARKQAPESSHSRKRLLVADLFCGAGGSSTGAKRAIEDAGASMELVAINHWNTAIATHQANHPTARHLVEDVSIVDPETVVPEGRLDLLMASPECRFYSRARGGKPVHDQGRMNPWAIHNWLTKLDINAVIIENVPEFVQWGPLDQQGHPIKAHRGQHFEAWFLTFQSLGYEAQWRMLNAADFGDATTRTRFFLMARKDGKPIHWPEPSHCKEPGPMMEKRQPWRGAREIIDWSDSGLSILDDPRYDRRPLAEKTMRRIAKGLHKFGGPLAPLYVRLLDLEDPPPPPAQQSPGAFIVNRHGDNGSDRIHSTKEPMPTATTRGAGYLAIPIATPFIAANRTDNTPKSPDEPIPPATTSAGGGTFIVQATITPFILGQQSQATPRGTADPVNTICADGAISLINPLLIRYNGQSGAEDPDNPLSTITAGARKHALVTPEITSCESSAPAPDHQIAHPTIIAYYGKSDASDVSNPLPTVTTKARHGLATPTLVQVNHGNGQQGHKGDDRRVHDLTRPVPAITTSPGLAIATPVLEEAPAPYLVPNFGERPGQEPRTHSIAEPVPACTSHGAGNLVTPTIEETILKHAELNHIDPRRLVIIDDVLYILDIRFRMLMNSELARAMSFSDPESTYEFVGNKSEITKQIGNAVPVRMSTALVKAALLQPDDA